MDNAIRQDIRKLLKIERNASEKLERYKKYRDAYSPIMFGLFIVPCILSAFKLMSPVLAILMFCISVGIAFGLSHKVSLCGIDRLLKGDTIDTEAIKQQLSSFKMKDIYRAKKIWSVVCWIYSCFFVVVQLFLLFCLAFAVIEFFSVNAVISCVYLIYINHAIYYSIKVRSRVYKTLVMLDEYDKMNKGMYAGEKK